MTLKISGRARLFGNDINTDYIISSRRKRDASGIQDMVRFLFEDIDPDLAATIMPDDIPVAGFNFGCGSAMEVAVTILQAVGIRAVVARSFARTYYRNAINNGLLPVVANLENIKDGDRIEIVISHGRVAVLTPDGTCVVGESIPPSLVAILEAGGLVPLLARTGTLQLSPGRRPVASDGTLR